MILIFIAFVFLLNIFSSYSSLVPDILQPHLPKQLWDRFPEGFFSSKISTLLQERTTSNLHSYCHNGKILSSNPVICVFDGWIPTDLCLHLLEILKHEEATPGKVDINGPTQEGGLHQHRRSLVSWLPHSYDERINNLSHSIAELVGLPVENAESYQLVSYSESGEYGPHFDASPPISRDGKELFYHPAGNRLVTVIGYLNDVKDGGSTEFPNIKTSSKGHSLKIKAKQGRLLLFHNCVPGYNLLHKNALHAGTPVLSGEKQIFNLWFRESNYQVLQPASASKRIPGSHDDL